MAKYVQDSSKTRWTIITPERLKRTGVDGEKFVCPFCSGNEKLTPPEVLRVGGGDADGEGWNVRVVPNKFNITDLHEVIIHSPNHAKNFEDFEETKIEEILNVYQNRFNALKEKGQVFVFSNCNKSSGASLDHPHSQVIVVPREVKTDTLPVQPVVNIVEQSESFTSYCPSYSEWPYEVWIKSNRPEIVFGELKGEIKELATALKKTIGKIKKIHDTTHFSKKPFGYNLYFAPHKDWYLRIVPRFIERAGVEISTGIMVNSVSPEKAAEELKNA